MARIRIQQHPQAQSLVQTPAELSFQTGDIFNNFTHGGLQQEEHAARYIFSKPNPDLQRVFQSATGLVSALFDTPEEIKLAGVFQFTSNERTQEWGFQSHSLENNPEIIQKIIRGKPEIESLGLIKNFYVEHRKKQNEDLRGRDTAISWVTGNGSTIVFHALGGLIPVEVAGQNTLETALANTNNSGIQIIIMHPHNIQALNNTQNLFFPRAARKLNDISNYFKNITKQVKTAKKNGTFQIIEQTSMDEEI